MSNKSRKWAKIIAIIAIPYLTVCCSGKKGSSSESESSTTPTANQATAILPLEKIAGKSRNDIEAILGKGTFVKNWKDKRAGCIKCPKYVYRGDSLEIIYIDGKADRITLNNPEGYSFNEELTGALGLPPMAPSFSNGDIMRWYGYKNFKEVMAAGDGHGNINFILVKTVAD